MTTLADVAYIRLGMAFKSAIKNTEADKGITLIQAKDIVAEGLPNQNALAYVIPTYNERKHIIKQNDIILRLRGPMFAAALFDGNYRAVTTNQVAVISCDSEKLNPYYLYWYINSQHGKRFFSNQNEGSGITKISTAALGNMPLTLPNKQKQNQIAKIYKNWQQQRAIQQQLIDNADELTKGICENIYQNGQN